MAGKADYPFLPVFALHAYAIDSLADAGGSGAAANLDWLGFATACNTAGRDGRG